MVEKNVAGKPSFAEFMLRDYLPGKVDAQTLYALTTFYVVLQTFHHNLNICKIRFRGTEKESSLNKGLFLRLRKKPQNP